MNAITPAQAAREILRRRAIKADLTTWCTHALAPQGLAPAAHHRLLLDKLAAVAGGEVRKLMVLMPPGSAKSTYSSVLFPPWFLAQAPSLGVLAASHTIGLAEQFSRRVQGHIRDNALSLGYGLATEAAEAWIATNGGAYRAAGVGSGIAGFRADLGLIDDPVRSREDADSKGQRDKAWDWYRADFFTRLKPGAAQVVIMTRWHEDDLGGRLLAAEPGEWEVVKLRAIAGEDDPLGRAQGEMLWGDDAYGYGDKLRDDFAFYQRTGGMRDWQALYQQEPRPAEGALFRVEQIGILDVAPAAAGRRVRAWDLAATKQVGTADPDWTVGLLMDRQPDNRLVISDVVRFRGGPEQVEAAIVNTAMLDGTSVRISLPQDPGQAGKAQIAYLTKRLLGYRVESSPETGDKATRAAPFAAQCNVGNVIMVQGGWNAAFRDELQGFPSAAKDDQVDAASRAFASLVDRGMPTMAPTLAIRPSAPMVRTAGGWMR